jgi:hypothetical protein
LWPRNERSVEDFTARVPAGTDVHHVFLDKSVSAVQARIARRAHRFDADKNRVLAIGSGAIAVARTTAARWPRSGSCRRSGRRQG